MREVIKFIEDQLIDFPNTKEVKQLKRELLANMEKKYVNLINNGLSKQDALDHLFSQFHLPEIKQEENTNHYDLFKTLKKIFLFIFIVGVIPLSIISVFYIKSYIDNGSRQAKIELIYNELISKSNHSNANYEFTVFKNIKIEKELTIKDQHHLIASFHYEAKDQRFIQTYDLSGLTMISYEKATNGKLRGIHFDILLYNSNEPKDILKDYSYRNLDTNQVEVIIWGRNENTFNKFIFDSFNHKEILIPNDEFVLIKKNYSNVTYGEHIVRKFITNSNDEIHASDLTKVPPLTHYYGTEFVVKSQNGDFLNQHQINDYRFTIEKDELVLGKNIVPHILNDLSHHQGSLQVIAKNLYFNLFYDEVVTIDVYHLYNDIENNIQKLKVGSYHLNPFKQDYETLEIREFIDEVLEINLKINFKTTPTLRLIEYKISEYQSGLLTNEILIDFKSIQNNLFTFKLKDNTGYTITKTFLNNENIEVTHHSTGPNDKFTLYLNEFNEYTWFRSIYIFPEEQ